MALSREERDMYARELMAEDPQLDYAVALSQVGQMETSGAFTPITEEGDGIPEYDPNADMDIPEYSGEGDIPEFTPEMDIPEYTPEEQVPAQSAYAQAAWQDTAPIEEDTSVDTEATPSVPQYLSPDYAPQRPTALSDGGLEQGLDASLTPDTPITTEELRQREFEQRHRENALISPEVKDKVRGWIGEFDQWMGDTFTAPENKGQYGEPVKAEEKVVTEGATHPLAIAAQQEPETSFQEKLQALDPRKLKADNLKEVVAIETDDGVVAHWEQVVENKARKLYVDGKAETPDEARAMAYDQHMGDVTEGAVNFATLFIPGVAPARWAVAFMQMGLKGRVAALTAAGMAESTAAGVAGNLAAGRPWNEGIKEDAAWGAVGGGAAGVLGEGVDLLRRAKVGKLEDTAETIVEEGAKRNEVQVAYRDTQDVKETIKDLKKNVEGYDPTQLQRAISAMPEGEVKDQMRGLLGGFTAEARAAREGSIEYFSKPDNIRKVDDIVGDIEYSAKQALEGVDSRYSALARLMEEGRVPRGAVDTSYIDNTASDKFVRGVEDKLLAGIPSRIRKAEFNKAQDKVRTSALGKVEDEILAIEKKLKDPTTNERAIKGARHQLREMRDVRDSLKSGKEVKGKDYAKSARYMGKDLKDELDNVQALQQYSAYTKTQQGEPIVDVATATGAQLGIGILTGGAYWGTQLAASVAIPALRGISQSARKSVIMKANSLVKKHGGDMVEIRKELNKMKPEEADYVLSALIYRLETAAGGDKALEETAQWQE